MYKPVLGKEKPAANETMLQDFHPIPLADIKASPMLVGELVADLPHRNPTCPFVTMFSATTYVETTNSTSLASLPESLPDAFDFCDMAPSAEVCINTSDGAVMSFSSPGEAAVQGFLDMRRLVQATGSLVAPSILAALEPSPQHARHVEQDTRGQSINNQWYYHRVGRISSSRSHQIGHIRDATDHGPILDTIFGCTNSSSPAPVPAPPVQTAAMSHGQKIENLARREYTQEKKKKGTPVSVVATGLFISTEHPWLATSPDGLVSDDSASDRFGVREIKCPFSSKPVEALAASSMSFCLRATGGVMSLKVSHPYYTQVQHHMAVVEQSWCDFVVFTVTVPAHTHSLAVVRGPRCQSFWTEHFIMKRI